MIGEAVVGPVVGDEPLEALAELRG